MYGPLWTMISLFITIPIFGNLNQFMKAYKNDTLEDYYASIDEIWFLMFCLIVYFFAVPYVIHTIFKWGSGAGSEDSRYFFIASIYGYSFVPFIPAIIVHSVPYLVAEYASLIFPLVASFLFLGRELYSLARAALDDSKLKLVCIIMACLHLAFIVMLKIWFL